MKNLDNIGIYDIKIDFHNVINARTSNIYYKEHDINTAKVLVKLVEKDKPINLKNIAVSINIQTNENIITDDVKIVDDQNGVVEYSFPTNTLVIGVNFFELVLTEGNNVKVSPRMAYNVIDSIDNSSSIESETNYPILINLIRDVNLALDSTKKAINEANAATSNANKATTESIKATEGANDATKKALESIENINKAIASGTNDLEVKEARDGEVSLKVRLDRDLYDNGVLKTDILKQKVEDIEGIKDIQDISYKTDKGSVLCESTKNGVVSNLKLTGKTLVNDWQPSSYKATIGGSISPHVTAELGDTKCKITINKDISSITGGNWLGPQVYTHQWCRDKIKANREYTLLFKLDTNISNTLGINICSPSSTDFIMSGLRFNPKKGINVLKFTTANTLPIDMTKQVIFIDMASIKNEGAYLEISDVCLIAGDHTKNPPNPFHKLMSFGEGLNNMSILTRKENGNLFDGKLEKGIYNHIGVPSTSNDAVRSVNYIYIDNKADYYIKLDNMNLSVKVFYYDIAKNFISSEVLSDTTIKKLDMPYSSYYIKFHIENLYINGFVYIGKYPNNMLDYEESKKDFLYYNNQNMLLPINILREFDSIEHESDKKCYWYKRNKTIVLNGSENWQIASTGKDDPCILFYTNKPDASSNVDSSKVSVVCDILNPYSADYLYANSVEGACINKFKNIQIRVSKFKLETPTVEGLKKWLQQNNVTVMYQLENIETYEALHIYLDSYDNETLALFSNGSVSPGMEFSITSHITNLVLLNKERINKLEDKMLFIFKELLNGGMQSLAYALYPNDFYEIN